METTETELKLSAYMRAGNLITKPAKNEMLCDDKVTGKLYACAVGAACLAKDPVVALAKLLYTHATLPEAARELFPELAELVKYHFPSDDEPSQTRLGAVIVNLNDVYGLDREAIADIVEALGY
jgi:hypothetical protein